MKKTVAALAVVFGIVMSGAVCTAAPASKTTKTQAKEGRAQTEAPAKKSAQAEAAAGTAAGAESSWQMRLPTGRSLAVEFLGDNAVRVSVTPPDMKADATGLLVAPAAAFTGRGGFTRGGDLSATSATGLGVRATRGGQVTVMRDGAVLVADDCARRQPTDSTTLITLRTGRPTHWLGAGERGYKLDLTGDTLAMYNKQNYGYTAGEPRIQQMNITMPLLVAADGSYAVVFDDYAAGSLIAGESELVYETECPMPVSYVVVTSPEKTLAGLTRELTAVTGRQEVAPLWALGYITSRYGYKTQAETLQAVDSLKSLGYPVDGVVLDLYWYGKEEDMGRLAWDAEQWPDHKAMLAELKDKGVKTVIISQPYILRNGRGVANYDQLAPTGALVRNGRVAAADSAQQVTIWVGEGGMFDVSNPLTRSWLAHRYKQLTDEGVTGWWGDLGEPEVHPVTGVHANGRTARQYHNKYGNDWSSIVYDLFKKEYPQTRLMTLMRGGTIGLQRYSVFPWSTDVSRSWGGLRPQVTIMQNSGLSGLGYMSHDVGGFAIDPEAPYDPELYVRWLQLGLFSPVLRTHAQQTAEPYYYPEQQDIILPLIKERYAWLPYNYTLALENARTGAPLVRPLGFADPQEPALDDQYLWGADVMVAPVLEQGARGREVYFPARGPWIDLNDPSKVYAGGSRVTVEAPLAVIPVFARAGAFIPKADYAMENTRDYHTGRYTVSYYPAPAGSASEYTLLEDNLTTPGSPVSSITFVGTDASVRITSNPARYPGYRPMKDIVLNIVGVDCPKRLHVDGQPMEGWRYEEKTRTVHLPLRYQMGSEMNVTW